MIKYFAVLALGLAACKPAAPATPPVEVPAPTAQPTPAAPAPTSPPDVPSFPMPPNPIVLPEPCHVLVPCSVTGMGFESFQLVDLYVDSVHAAKMVWDKSNARFTAQVLFKEAGPHSLSIQSGDDILAVKKLTVTP